MKEKDRLEALYEYGIMDSPPEQSYDDLTLLAQFICKTSIASINFVDLDRVWIKSRIGIDLLELPRDQSFCTHTIAHGGVLVVEDCKKDSRFSSNPFVTSSHGIAFYAGIPLRTQEGHFIGTICIADQKPRTLSQAELLALEALSRQVIVQLELSRSLNLQTQTSGIIPTRKNGYRNLIENLKEIIFQTDTTGLWTYLSPAWTEVFGHDLNGSIGKKFLDYVHPDDRKMNDEKFQPLINREKNDCRHEIRYIRSDGTFRWVEVFARLTLARDNSIIGTTGTITDIHDRKIAQENLRQEKEKLDLIANNIGDVVWMTDIEKSNVVYISPSYEKIWERSCLELYENPHSFIDAIHPEDRERITSAFSKQSEGTYNETYRIITPRGEVKWIQDRAFAIRKEDGVIYRTVGIASDITDKIKYQSVIEEQKEKFETIVNNVPILLTVYDEKGQFEWANPSFEKMLGWSVEEARSRNLLEDFYPDPDKYKEVLDFMSLPKSTDWMAFETRTKMGTTVPTSWMNVRLSSGKSIGIGLDISVQRAHEKVIQEQQVQIISAAKMSSLGEMAAGVAHEINNPLTIIMGNTQILKQFAKMNELSASDVLNMCSKIDNTVVRIAKIVSGLKTFARDGSKDPFEKINLSKLIEETLSFCEARFKSHQVKMIVEKIDPELELDCRSIQMSQVLLNLLNNAFDAVSSNQNSWVKISVEASANNVILCVEDSGPGIPVAIQDKIMEPFFTTKEVGKGTGLGLSLCKGLIESQNGTLELDTGAAHTKFVLKLPKTQIRP